jgi:hypothetical protein
LSFTPHPSVPSKNRHAVTATVFVRQRFALHEFEHEEACLILTLEVVNRRGQKALLRQNRLPGIAHRSVREAQQTRLLPGILSNPRLRHKSRANSDTSTDYDPKYRLRIPSNKVDIALEWQRVKMHFVLLL